LLTLVKGPLRDCGPGHCCPLRSIINVAGFQAPLIPACPPLSAAPSAMDSCSRYRLAHRIGRGDWSAPYGMSTMFVRGTTIGSKCDRLNRQLDNVAAR
jgi:hypothetical protein